MNEEQEPTEEQVKKYFEKYLIEEIRGVRQMLDKIFRVLDERLELEKARDSRRVQGT